MGVVFYDLSSGRGVTYNADVEVYGASSYKALYALYICETLVESDQVSLDWPLATYGGYNMGWQTVRDLIEAAVVYSDNDSFIAYVRRLTVSVTRIGLSVLASITIRHWIR